MGKKKQGKEEGGTSADLDIENGGSGVMEGKEDQPDEADLYTEVLEEQNKSIVWAIIKQIKVGTEVKHLQLPTFVLQPRSLLEKLTDSLVHPQIIMGIGSMENPEERFLAAVKFYLSGWHIRPKGVKNPLNPVCGEVFKAGWTFNGQEIHYVAEQLSHHPPHSAFSYWNVDAGVFMNANIAPTYVKFYGNSAESTIKGLIRLSVYGKNFEEEYEFTYPSMLVKGILFGSLHLEVIGKVSIQCKATGYSADIEFKQKAMFRGKYNSIVGKIKKSGKTTHSIGGFWDSVVTITDSKSKKTSELFNNTVCEVHNRVLPPKEEMPENESRRLWADVVKGMLAGNENDALDAKRKIEEVQRAAENERTEKKVDWIPALFTKDSEDYYWFNQRNDIIAMIKEKKSKGKVETQMEDPFQVFSHK